MADYLTLFSEARYGDAILEIKRNRLQDSRACLTRAMALHKVGHSRYVLLLLRNLEPPENLEVALRITWESRHKPSQSLLKGIIDKREYLEDRGLRWMADNVSGIGDIVAPYPHCVTGCELDFTQFYHQITFLWLSHDFEGAFSLCRWWQQVVPQNPIPTLYLLFLYQQRRDHASTLETISKASPEIQMHPQAVLDRLRAQFALSPNEELFKEILHEFNKYPFHKVAWWLYRKSVGWNSLHGHISSLKHCLALIRIAG